MAMVVWLFALQQPLPVGTSTYQVSPETDRTLSATAGQQVAASQMGEFEIGRITVGIQQRCHSIALPLTALEILRLLAASQLPPFNSNFSDKLTQKSSRADLVM
ncbi:hypothetical protein FIBSPDRAFT_899735 [Athelia psychrophila]|uniref:Uncharacterized protein n=1 Tax=Athelia psychrophila TaxID=1759441 RepID=A0A165ZEI5_9AGAM|nr:hypothetical protein FIBSPDRAFT_899735 [Fibularhizoctonia sp. CBS 109695]